MSNFEVDFIEMARKELKNQTVIGTKCSSVQSVTKGCW